MSKSKKRKRAQQRRGSNQPLRGIRPYTGWIVGGGAALVAVAVGGFLLIGPGGGSGDDTTAPITATPVDPRVGAATPAVSLAVSADDDGQEVNPRFEPNTLNGPAAQVVEIAVTNNGSVVHNLNVSGPDRAYDTTDDFRGAAVQPGATENLRLKINDPGSYPFRCDFHPQLQIGTLVLR